MMTFKEAAAIGRQDGSKQKDSKEDFMKFDFNFPTLAHWKAYMTAFYRACGYHFSNKLLRRL